MNLTDAEARDYLRRCLDSLAARFTKGADPADPDSHAAARAVVFADLDVEDLYARAFITNPHTGTREPRPWLHETDAEPTDLLAHADLFAAVQQCRAPAGPSVAAVAPCPDWCDVRHQDDGHRYTLPDPDRGESAPFRIHRHRLGPNPTHVAVEAYDRGIMLDPAAPITVSDLGHDLDALTVAIYSGGGSASISGRPALTLSPAGARALAAQLTAAAALAETQVSDWRA